MKKSCLNARFFLLIILTCITLQPYLFAEKKEEPRILKKETSEIPLTEDLMREHDILNRVLLIYEEIIERIDTNKNFPTAALGDAVDIIKSFIEDYHEKLEEDYIFPLFKKHKKEIRLITTLQNQHDKGRTLTAQLQKIAVEKKNLDQKNKKLLKTLLQKFIRMYRPHAAREGTVLFPQIHTLLSKQEFDELSETFENREHELFGEDGFETMVKKIATIEKKLGIYQLEQFTPISNDKLLTQ